MAKSIWNWVVVSSADPKKLALTVKAGLPFLVSLFLLFGYHVDASALGEFVDAAVNVAVLVVALVSGLATVYGAGRKVKNTVVKK